MAAAWSTPSLAKEAAIQLADRLNVSNLRDNGQSTEPTPTAAMAGGPDLREIQTSGSLVIG